jgi:hypothetical protein
MKYSNEQKKELLSKLATLQKEGKHSRISACRELGLGESTVRGWEKLDLSEIEPVKKKTGYDIKNEHVVVNWTTRTVITELGEFGSYTCSLDMHKAIMRMYSDQYEGKGSTQAEIAMKFDFAHTKAVAKYMKAHGMSKSMIGQTDLELEEGLSVEDAVAENIQSLKRKIHKDTERKKWREVQNAADNWWNLHHGTLKPFDNHIEQYLPKHKIKKLNLSSFKKNQTGKEVAVVGISDVHYMKNCFDSFGNNIYNREIAKERLFNHAKRLINQQLQAGGVPEKFVLMIGADNLHIDNPRQTTTRGTEQANSTDGSYRIELGAYLDMTMALIETFAQVAPVDVVSTPGNHDLHTSYFLAEAISRIYRNQKEINVIVRYQERIYLRYGKTCIIVSHGDKISLSRTKREVHKLIMSEARSQGINPNEIEEWVFIMQHLHHEEQIDLGGNTELIVLPSMSEADDWHSDSGYVGSKINSMLIVYDYMTGKKRVLYAGREQII